MRYALAALLLAVLTAGCASPTPPLVQVYAAKQAYAGSLDTLTTLINTGQIHDANTLMRIRDTRSAIEAGLAAADAAARSGDTATFKFWMDQVNAALETYLKLQGPATRPVSLNSETPWTPPRSRLSFCPPRRSWALSPAPSTRCIAAAN